MEISFADRIASIKMVSLVSRVVSSGLKSGLSTIFDSPSNFSPAGIAALYTKPRDDM
ncbi:MAG: Uncharacterised protein [Bacteroidia bacterium]|nr:MAG: Uncharacterised protein [Bacteroidia bacterium]